MTDRILKTKLTLPPLRPELVPRPRLLSRLDATLQRKLTLISAPAGYGKTTLAAAWLAQLPPPLHTAWLSLDEADDDLVRFLTYLTAVLPPPLTNEVAGALAGLQSGALAAEAVIIVMINHLAAAPTPLVLALDDYHVLQTAAIHTAVSFLLDHLPAHCHLLLTTRTQPPLPLARLRGRHQLLELRQADLAFTEAEAAAFLNQVMDLSLSVEEVAALSARTEGWVTGLQMAAVSMQGRNDVAGFIQAFTGSHRYVLDYLMVEVLQRQPPAIQTFLLYTAVLDQFNADLCEFVLHQEATEERPLPRLPAQELLEQLEAANLFLIPLDDRRRWFRYHHLFAGLLRQRLQQVAPHQTAVLHRRAGEWYAAQGRYPDAIHHLLAAQETAAAAALIEEAAEETLVRSEISTFLRWIEALPEAEVRARPLLCVYHAGALLVDGQPFTGIEQRLVEAADTAGSAADSGAVAVMQALIAAFQGDVSRSAQLAQQAMDNLPPQSRFLRSLVTQNLAIVQMLHGDIHAAIASLRAAAQAAGNVMLQIVSLCNAAELHIVGGQLATARALYEEAWAQAVDQAGRPLPIAGMARMGLGELARERNDLSTAVADLQAGIDLIRHWGKIGALDGYIALARVRQAQGQTAAAREMMQAAQQMAARFDATELDDLFVDLMLLPLMLAQGDVATAAARLEAHRDHLAAVELPFHLWEMGQLAQARLALAQKQPGAALAHLAETMPRTTALQRHGVLIQLLLVQARAQQQLDQTAAAHAAVERAVALAEPAHYVRIFLDEGAAIRVLLAAVRAQLAAQPPLAPAQQKRLRYLDTLLAAFAAEPSATPPATPPALLSAREQEILHLVATGMTNRQIAARLVIAHSTVKSHINHIYRKLDVRARQEAIRRAQELGLL